MRTHEFRYSTRFLMLTAALPVIVGAMSLASFRQASADELVLTQEVPLGTTAVPAVTCHNENGKDAKTYLCNGTFQGGLCSGGYYRDIAFSRPYAAPPKVLVTARNVSDQGGCVGGATDKVVCKAENITTTGFRLTCFGSPESGSCGNYNGWTTYASADWIALENSPECRTAGANNLSPSVCTSTSAGGLCKGTFMQRVNFETPFKTVPHVLTAAENLSDQGGCVGGSTDKLLCNPANISTTGFDLHCSGSPASSCGDKEGWKSLAKAGFIAKESTDLCKVESGHGIETDHCPGSAAGNVCSKPYEKRITFSKMYASPPQVIVSAEDITSAGTACAQGATDKVVCFAKDITTTGFTAVCSGSPQGGSPATTQQVQGQPQWVCVPNGQSFKEKLFHKGGGCTWTAIPQTTTVSVPATQCGQYEGWNTKAKFGYLVVDNQCGGGTTSSSSSSMSTSSSSVSTSASSISTSASSISTSSSSSINPCVYYPWLCSSASSVSTSSSSTVSSAPVLGCIDVLKETYDTQGHPLHPVAQFTFILDGNPQSALKNGGNGRVRFTGVAPGPHRVTEILPYGWAQYSVTPGSGSVLVHPDDDCATVVFKNQQIVPTTSSSVSSSSSYLPYCVQYPHLCSSPSSSSSSSVSSSTYCQIFPQYCASSSSSVSACGWSCPGTSSASSVSTSSSSVSSSASSFHVGECPSPAPAILHMADLKRIDVYERTAASWEEVSDLHYFLPTSAKLREDIAQSPSLFDFSTNAHEYYDVFVSDAFGNLDPNGRYLTIDDYRDGSYTNGQVGNNIDAVALHLNDGRKVWANIVTHGELGTGLSGEHLTSLGYNQYALGQPDKYSTKMGDRHSSITVGFCNSFASSSSVSTSSSSSASSCGGFWSCMWPWGGNQNVHVDANANTTVNNQINAGSQNQTNVWQSGTGNQNANVDANANTTVNNQINAGSQNDVWVNQAGWW